jgi:hypothetical protein
MKVINLFGAPGAGKSTTMLDLTSDMKLLGLSVENTPEFFKELILEDSHKAAFGGQLYILGEQNRRLARLEEKNDFAVTDCPLPLIGYYTPEDYVPGFNMFVKNLYNRYDNMNYFILRKHEFEKEKRIHSEEQSDKIANDLIEMLESSLIKFKIFDSCPEVSALIIEDMVREKVLEKSFLEKYVKFQNVKIERINALANKFKPKM